MSMDDKNLSKISLFGNVTTKYCEPKRGLKKTFHEAIQGDKDFIFNFFESQPYYNEVMPTIIKNSRGNNFYKKIIRKGIDRKSDFFRGILRAINEVGSRTPQNANQEKIKKIRYYRIPKLELLKKRKKKYEIYLQKKNKTADDEENKFIKKSNSQTKLINFKEHPSSNSIFYSTIDNNTTQNIINNNNNNNNNNINNNISRISIETFHTNSHKNESMNNILNLNSSKYSLNNLTKKNPSFYITKNSSFSRNIKGLKNYFSNSQDKSIKVKTLKLGKLLDKCSEQLNYAKSIEDNVEKYNKNNSVKEIKQKIKNSLQNRDQKVIEDKGSGNKKYKKLEKEKFNELKKKMNIIKVSEDYAYVNRKELHEFMKDNENIFAYQLYMKEMNNINEKIAKKKEIEKKNLSLVENLLEDDYRKKEFLKYKIDNYYLKHARQNELKKFTLKNRDDFYLNKNNNGKEELSGTLLPKIMLLKDYCYGRPKYNRLPII